MTVYVGDLLTATAASVTGKPTPSRTWKWLRDGTAISGATSSSYTITDSDLDAILAVEQTETNVGGVARATSSTVGPVATYSPVGLFALAEPGVWYDPSDLTTLFQDTAGTTPVTTPGQTVALVLDKSRGLVLGPELVTNGTFGANSSAGWTLNTWTVANNRLEKTAGDNLRASGTLTSALVSGRYYKVTLDASNFATACNVFLRTGVGGTSNTGYSIPSGSATHSFVMQATDAHTVIQFFPSSTGFSGTIDNISVRELPGNHATQATAASRPTYGVVPLGGRRNLLTYTEQFDNAYWTKTAVTVSTNTSATTDPVGSNTADVVSETTNTAFHFVELQTAISFAATQYTFTAYLKQGTQRYAGIHINDGTARGCSIDLQTGTLGTPYGSATASRVVLANGWYRLTVTATVSATASGQVAIYMSNSNSLASYAGNTASNIYIWGAQLETGSTATNYQRVGSAFDVTEAGVPSLSYLSFDGVDDFLVTPTITPGVDKAQVFAGVRKLSDAGYIAELSVDASSNSGTTRLFAVTGGYSFQSRGTINAASASIATGFAAPVTNVLTGLGDISGNLATLRVNGTQAAQSTASQGTGNYLAYPLYIGRRGGTSNPFNGNIFSLIVRFGANLDQTDINRAERWVADKTGVTL